MKELLILSGKGGTGKTTLCSSIIKLSKTKTFSDCDVDAPNLHLLTNLKNGKDTPFYGLEKAQIDNTKCVQCKRCYDNCRFDAIDTKDNKLFINAFKCEGCGVCQLVCPKNAINMSTHISGTLTLYKDNKTFSTARLKTGAGVSGKLVSEVKRQMRENATPCDFAVIDGSPGIGCPVIASLSGATMVLVVTEPTLSGLSDLKRIVKTAGSFQPKIGVVINKYDVNVSICNDIENYCNKNNIMFLGKLPYDKQAIVAVNSGKTVVDFDCPLSVAIKQIYNKIVDLI